MDPNRKPRWYFGGLASAAAGAVLHPLDLLKVHHQTHAHHHKAKGGSGEMPKVSSFRSTVELVQGQGVRSLYTGLTASLMRQLMYSGTRFALYDTTKGLIDPEGKGLGFTTSFLLAGFSGAVGAVVGSPPDLVLVRMQSDIRLPKEQRRQYRNGVHGVYRVFVEEGFTKLFYGVEWNAVRAFTLSVGQMCFYDFFKGQFMARTERFKRDTVETQLLSSFCAGIVTALITQPVDTLKTIAMHQRSGEQGGAMAVLRETRRLGIPYFFRGSMVRFLRLGPYTVLIFMFKEQLTHRFGYLPSK